MPTKRRKEGFDPREVMKALSSEPRQAILRSIPPGESQVRGPRESVDELGMTLSTAAYHYRVLADLGLIVLRRRKAKRGAISHFYGWAPGAREHPMVVEVLGLEDQASAA